MFRLGLGTGFSNWRDAKGNTQFVQTDASKRPSLTQSKTVFKGLLVPDFSSGDFLVDETPTDKFDVGDGDFYIMAAIRTPDTVSRATIICLQRDSVFTPSIQLGIIQNRAGKFIHGDVLGVAFPAQSVTGTTELSSSSNTVMLVYLKESTMN